MCVCVCVCVRARVREVLDVFCLDFFKEPEDFILELGN